MVLIDSAGAGDIISMAGLTRPAIGHTVASVEVSESIYYLQFASSHSDMLCELFYGNLFSASPSYC